MMLDRSILSDTWRRTFAEPDAALAGRSEP